MNIYELNAEEIILFFVSLVRITSLFLIVPIFGDARIPPTVKILLSFTINIVVFPISTTIPQGDLKWYLSSDLGILALILKEAILGFCIGFIAKLFFDGLSFAFSYMGMQMGFNMASVYDQHTESSVPVASQFVMILATLLFLAIDGHHLFLKGLVESYSLVPIGGFEVKKTISLFVLETAESVFSIAVKLSAPMAITVFLINCGFGIVAKAVPQINVLIVSFTVNILAGFVVISLTLPIFGTTMGDVFQRMVGRMIQFINIFS
ncbi:MAG: flagellar biosynthetic protein FliR [Oligoflexia bacterium]|nr:flagellar biosynthetic protein FliR [Oligoflexia bacterium]